MKWNGIDENGELLPELSAPIDNPTKEQKEKYRKDKEYFEEKHQTKIGEIKMENGENINISEVFEMPKKNQIA